MIIWLPVDALHEWPEGVGGDVGPHITVLYVPEAPIDAEAVFRAVATVAQRRAAPWVRLGELDAWDADGGIDVVRVHEDGVRELRREVLAALSTAGVAAQSKYPAFKPHVTLGASGRFEQPPHAEGYVGEVAVKVGDAVRRFPFGVEASTDVAWRECSATEATNPAQRPVPAGMRVGQTFRCTATGRVFDRHTGEQSGRDVTLADLDAACRYWRETGDQIPLTRHHDGDDTLGVVVGLAVVDDGDRHSLVVTPAYNAAGAAWVDGCGGALWSSPRLQWGRFYCARSGAHLSPLRVKEVGLTTSPAQTHVVLDEVRLTETPGGPAVDPIELFRASGATPDMLAKAEALIADMPDADPADQVKALFAMVNEANMAEDPEDADETMAELDLGALRRLIEGAGDLRALAAEAGITPDELLQVASGSLDPTPEVQGALEAAIAASVDANVQAEHGERITKLEAALAEQTRRLRKMGDVMLAEAKVNAQKRLEAEFERGVDEARWSEGERRLWFHARTDAEVFAAEFGSRKPGHTGAELRFTEAAFGEPPLPGHLTASPAFFDLLEEGETVEAGMARLLSDPKHATKAKAVIK